MMEFVGREAELKRFDALLKGTKGELWAIRGEGGLGKSSLLQQFVQQCERQKREFLFIDVERLSIYKTAAEFLLSLSVANLPSFAPTVQKAKGVYETLKMQLESNLKTYAPELQAAGAALTETYVKEEHEKQIAAVMDKYLSILINTGTKLFNSKAEQEKKTIAENVEHFLMLKLKEICKKHPIIFVDTYEHLEVKAFLNTQHIESQLTHTFEVSPEIHRIQLKVWINRWLTFLSQQGAIVIVAGREFEVWKLKSNDLMRFNEEEIKKVVFKCDYAEICTIRDNAEQLVALLAVLKKLSFEGSPLWLAVGLNLVALLLKEGRDIFALAKEDDTLKQCFEYVDGTLEPDEIENANCKMAIFKRITRQLSDELIDNAWRLALPRYLDSEILQLLLGQEAEKLIELYKSLQILNFKRSEQRFFLHESIRDLLIFYAKNKKHWQSESALKLHEQLATLFEQRAKTKAVFLDKIEVEYLELTLAKEMCFHRHQGQEFDLETCMGDTQYSLALGCQRIKENDKNNLGWFRLGYALQDLNRYEEAIISCDKALALQPDDARAWYNRGNALQDLNRYEEAIISCDKALALQPDYASAWNNRGSALFNLNRYEEAIASYDKALALQPDDAIAWNNRGNTLKNLNRYAEAVDSYEIALSYHPNDIDILENRGIAFLKLGIYSKAAQSFAQVLSIQADYLSTLSNDIELALIQNDLPRMQQRLAVALPLLKNDSQEFVILPFLQWLANPQTSLQPLLTAIQNLAPDVEITWDFSDTQPAIRRLSPEHKAIAQHFIKYFQGTINFTTLQQKLGNHD